MKLKHACIVGLILSTVVYLSLFFFRENLIRAFEEREKFTLSFAEEKKTVDESSLTQPDYYPQESLEGVWIVLWSGGEGVSMIQNILTRRQEIIYGSYTPGSLLFFEVP